jgi:glycosyltransferase involved in cell wall biosynthesis
VSEAIAAERITFVLPTYNEEGVGDVVAELRRLHPGSAVLVVDDGSQDRSADVAAAAGARVVRHPYNKGNGAAVETGLRGAATEYVVLLDADGQHPPQDASLLIDKLGQYDLVIGARDRAAASDPGRRLANAVFNGLASYLAGMPIPDLTSGFRAGRRDRLLEFIHLYPNGFSYPTTSTLSFVRAGYDVAFVPVTTRSRRRGRSKIRPLHDGVGFLLIILKLITLYNPLKVFLPLAAAFAAVGAAYGTLSFVVRGRIANGAVLAWITAMFVFLIGLISEQISALRSERRDS